MVDNCSKCGRSRSEAEQAAFGGRCEDCFAEAQPGSTVAVWDLPPPPVGVLADVVREVMERTNEIRRPRPPKDSKHAKTSRVA